MDDRFSKKKNCYISPNVDCHSGGTWKIADSMRNLDFKITRMGTYDAELMTMNMRILYWGIIQLKRRF